MKTIILSIFIAVQPLILFAQEKVTLSGDYESVTGRMNPLSCYCYNGGYLSFGKGNVESVCFDDLGEGTEVKDGFITVTGYYKTLTHTSTPHDPCPEGTQTVLVVTSYSIVSEDIDDRYRQWNGIWDTNFGEVNISVSGNSISGTYKHKNGTIKGEVAETMHGTMINGEWNQSDGYGWFTFSMERGDVNNFSGEWGYYRGEDRIKEFAKGEWNGSKK